MSISFFYAPGLAGEGFDMELDEANSRHCVQVLRMRAGDPLLLTDGNGTRAKASILYPDKKHTTVRLGEHTHFPRQGREVHIGISPIKNASRYEWFLEKATEIGVAGIIPLICERTERSSFRADRLGNILVSAMLQSQQTWLPVLGEPQTFSSVIKNSRYRGRYIAHCVDGEKGSLPAHGGQTDASIILIGPEGDFTPAEVREALGEKWVPVSLGDTRLRTETAGIVAVTLLRLA